MTDYADVPDDVIARLRTTCLGLPETTEQQAWAGLRWCIRKRSFAHVVAVDDENGPKIVLIFRSTGDELEVLHRSGHPFFRPGWGTNVVGMVIDDDADWTRSPSC